MLKVKTEKLVLLILIVLQVSVLNAQVVTKEYPIGKLFMLNGLDIEGTNLRITKQTATIEVMGQDQVFMLNDVMQIMAKEGKAKKIAKNCGLACVGCNLLPLLFSSGSSDANGEEYEIEISSVIIGAALYGGLSYGIGYLIGQSTDHWEIVYLNRG